MGAIRFGERSVARQSGKLSCGYHGARVLHLGAVGWLVVVDGGPTEPRPDGAPAHRPDALEAFVPRRGQSFDRP